MNAYYKGQPIFGPRGPAGPDGNPIGTIISYMGLTAPKDYLICDGTAYPISDYPELAEFFRRQFGSANHFGGDGETTFAVPDMRNLFLRGYHADTEELLSGGLGERQEATKHLNWIAMGGTTSRGVGILSNNPQPVIDRIYPDSILEKDTTIQYIGFNANSKNFNGSEGTLYTSRPVNMAVLYCIKAVESVPAENVYSTEETRIGTWIDGKPLYRRIIKFTIPGANNTVVPLPDGLSIAEVVHFYGTIFSTNRFFDLQTASMERPYMTQIDIGLNEINIYTGNGFFVNAPVTLILEYTKTTD